MDSEKVQDPLKPLDEICEPDMRQKFFRGDGLDRNHAELSGIVLSKKVPVDVRQLFETGKNLSLYSWFVYRFHQVSELVAYSALEMALRLRYEKESGKTARVSLKKLLEYAQKENWINNEEFSWLMEGIPWLRNELAHGSSTLIPSSVASLRVVAEVINQIYE